MLKRAWGRLALLSLFLAVLYYALGALTLWLAAEFGIVTSLVFPAEGVALAFCILFGPRVAVGILLGQFLLALTSGLSIPAASIVASVNMVEGIIGVLVFRYLRLSPSLSRPRDCLGIFLLIVVLLQPLSASGGLFAHWIEGSIPPGGFQSLWVSWWMGNAVGQLIFTPLLLTWFHPSRKAGFAGLLAIAGTILAAWGALFLGPFIKLDSISTLVITYPLLISIGIHASVSNTARANAVLALSIVWLGGFGLGPFEPLSMAARYKYIGFIAVTASGLSMLIASMFAQHRRLIEQLHKLSYIDSLTGISNRAHFIEGAEAMVLRAQTEKRPLAVLMMDFDHFKKVNDTFGHAVGDKVLQFVAAICLANIRKGDIIGRLGGEEFAIVFPDTTLAEATKIAERLRSAISATGIPARDGIEINQTVSMGITDLQREDTFQVALNRADQLLLQAKRRERNRIVVCDGGASDHEGWAEVIPFATPAAATPQGAAPALRTS